MATLGICAFSDRKQNGYAGYSGGGVGGRRRDGVPWELKGRQINGEPDVSWPQDRGLRHSGRRAAGSAGGRAVPLAVPGPGPVGRRLPRRLRPEGPAGPAPRAGRSSLPSRRRRGAVANMAAKVSECRLAWGRAAPRRLPRLWAPPSRSQPPTVSGGGGGKPGDAPWGLSRLRQPCGSSQKSAAHPAGSRPVRAGLPGRRLRASPGTPPAEEREGAPSAGGSHAELAGRGVGEEEGWECAGTAGREAGRPTGPFGVVVPCTALPRGWTRCRLRNCSTPAGGGVGGGLDGRSASERGHPFSL